MIGRIRKQPRPGKIGRGEGIVYIDATTGKIRARTETRDVLLESSGGGGVSAHPDLTSLTWSASGHTGTAARLAGFNGSGVAAYYQIGADVQAYSAPLATIAGLTLGATGLGLLEDATAADGRSTLGLGDSATRDVGTGPGDVAAGDAPAAAQAAAEATADAALAAHAADADLHLGSPSNTDVNAAFGRGFDAMPVGVTVSSPGTTLTTGGTLAAQIDSDGKAYVRFTANAAAIAGLRMSSNNFLIMASGGTLYFRVRLPTSAAGRRLWIGWQSVLVGSGATPAGHYAGLVMDSQTAGDTSVFACARDGTTFSTTDTSVDLSADTEYFGTVRIDASGVYVAIAAAGGSLPAETAHTTNLPGTATTLGMIVALYGSGTHSFDFRGANYNVEY